MKCKLRLIKAESIKLPFLASPIPAGFPSPACDFIEDLLDLQALLVRTPSSTYLTKAKDNGLSHLGIYQDDLLIVDSSLKPHHLSLVVVLIYGDLLVRQYDEKRKILITDAQTSAINIESSDVLIQGVITYSIRSHYNKRNITDAHLYNLKADLIKNIASTFLARANGHSLMGVGIFDNDIMIIDRSLSACHGKLVVAVINGEFLAKRFDKIKGLLISENPLYPPINVKHNSTLYIEGVITFSIRSHYWIS